MQIKIESLTFEITPAIKVYIEKKVNTLNRFLKRFEKEREIIAFVEILKTTRHHKHGNVFKASIKIDLDKTSVIGTSVDLDLRTAIDKAKDKVKENILRYKEKLNVKRLAIK